MAYFIQREQLNQEASSRTSARMTMEHTASEPAVARVLERDENASVSRLFEVLADERRRTLVAVLFDQTAPVDAVTLARHVAARTADVSPDAVPSEAVDEVHLTLHHVHLPKMAQAGLLTFDSEAGVVRNIALMSGD
jgi:hypothetical protein